MKNIRIQKKEGYAILELSRGKANPLNNEMIVELRKALSQVALDEGIRGLIITGNTPGYFSVGLDIKEIYNYNESQIMDFWENWENMIAELVAFPKPLIAAVNGYSPAGGCVIALTCDHRCMAEESRFSIGLNEVAVGIVVPSYIFELFSFWCGKSMAYRSLLQARLFNPAEALEIGMVHELQPTEQVLVKAESTMKEMIKIPSALFRLSKLNMRSDLIDSVRSANQHSKEAKLKAWFDPSSRKVMKSLLDKLSK